MEAGELPQRFHDNAKEGLFFRPLLSRLGAKRIWRDGGKRRRDCAATKRKHQEGQHLFHDEISMKFRFKFASLGRRN
jgi:hypothetical protein